MSPATTSRISRTVISFGLGFSSLFVFFVAASMFEVRGENSIREIVAGCLFGAPYLAFCQFWVSSPGRRGLGGKWLTVLAMVAPLLFVLPLIDRGAVLGQGVPMAVTGLLGCLVGALLSGRLARPNPVEPLADSGRNRRENCRLCLKIGTSLLIMAALLVAVGVIPPLWADSTPGFAARAVATVMAIAVAIDLLAALVMAFVALRPQTLDRPLRVTLGVPAFFSLLLAMFYAFGSGIGSQNPSLHSASVLLMLCATLALVTTALVTVTVIFVDRPAGANAANT